MTEDLIIKTPKSEVTEIFGVPVSIRKVQLKGDGYKWTFHKNDADTWPSDLHAHDYDRRLKLDARTGKIYDAITKSHCGNLSRKALDQIQARLLISKDFRDRAKTAF